MAGSDEMNMYEMRLYSRVRGDLEEIFAYFLRKNVFDMEDQLAYLEVKYAYKLFNEH